MIRPVRVWVYLGVPAFIALFFMGMPTAVYAGITAGGDLDPSAQSFWTGGGDSGETGTVGAGADGWLGVDDGSVLMLDSGTLGRDDGTTGTVTVTGSGSRLDLDGDLEVGAGGIGSLTVSSGGWVTNNYGIVGIWSTGQGTVIVEGTDSEWEVGEHLFLGYQGKGGITIRDGGRISSKVGAVAYISGALGQAVIQGTDSLWRTTKDFCVGFRGNGTLDLEDGGGLEVGAESYIGNDAAATGTAKVTGGTWDGSRSLNVGNNGATAVLNICRGGRVNMDWDIKVHTAGTVNILADGDDVLNAGVNPVGSWGEFINEGVVNLVAPGDLTAGSYSPITHAAGLSFIDGTINPVGGSWDSGTHRFIVSNITTGATGSLGARRIEFDAGALVVGFAESVGAETFEVSAINPGPINGKSLLAAYAFDTTVSGGLTALTFFLDDTYDPDDLDIWRLPDGDTEWIGFDPTLTDNADGAFTFTVNEFGSYAVTGPDVVVTATIPTLSQWGRIMFCLLLGAMGTRLIRQNSGQCRDRFRMER